MGAILVFQDLATQLILQIAFFQALISSGVRVVVTKEQQQQQSSSGTSNGNNSSRKKKVSFLDQINEEEEEEPSSAALNEAFVLEESKEEAEEEEEEEEEVAEVEGTLDTAFQRTPTTDSAQLLQVLERANLDLVADPKTVTGIDLARDSSSSSEVPSPESSGASSPDPELADLPKDGKDTLAISDVKVAANNSSESRRKEETLGSKIRSFFGKDPDVAVSYSLTVRPRREEKEEGGGGASQSSLASFERHEKDLAEESQEGSNLTPNDSAGCRSQSINSGNEQEGEVEEESSALEEESVVLAGNLSVPSEVDSTLPGDATEDGGGSRIIAGNLAGFVGGGQGKEPAASQGSEEEEEEEEEQAETVDDSGQFGVVGFNDHVAPLPLFDRLNSEALPPGKKRSLHKRLLTKAKEKSGSIKRSFRELKGKKQEGPDAKSKKEEDEEVRTVGLEPAKFHYVEKSLSHSSADFGQDISDPFNTGFSVGDVRYFGGGDGTRRFGLSRDPFDGEDPFQNKLVEKEEEEPEEEEEEEPPCPHESPDISRKLSVSSSINVGSLDNAEDSDDEERRRKEVEEEEEDSIDFAPSVSSVPLHVPSVTSTSLLLRKRSVKAEAGDTNDHESRVKRSLRRGLSLVSGLKSEERGAQESQEEHRPTEAKRLPDWEERKRRFWLERGTSLTEEKFSSEDGFELKEVVDGEKQNGDGTPNIIQERGGSHLTAVSLEEEEFVSAVETLGGGSVGSSSTLRDFHSAESTPAKSQQQQQQQQRQLSPGPFLRKLQPPKAPLFQRKSTSSVSSSSSSSRLSISTA